MKVQWQLIDIETKKPLAMIGESFDLDPDSSKTEFIRQFAKIWGKNDLDIRIDNDG